MKDFKVGDKVYCLLCGEGEVYHVSDSPYGVDVDFDNDKDESFTVDGRITLSTTNQCLFHLGEQPELVYPEFEYQVLYKHKNCNRFCITNGHYITINEFIEGFQNASDIEHTELIEKSKRVRKRND